MIAVESEHPQVFIKKRNDYIKDFMSYREASIMRMGERTDMAGQMAMAFHQPHDLQKMEMRYLKAAGQLSQMFEHTKARLMHVAQAAAQAKPTPEA